MIKWYTQDQDQDFESLAGLGLFLIITIGHEGIVPRGGHSVEQFVNADADGNRLPSGSRCAVNGGR